MALYVMAKKYSKQKNCADFVTVRLDTARRRTAQVKELIAHYMSTEFWKIISPRMAHTKAENGRLSRGVVG
jgi:hypothetical protein